MRLSNSSVYCMETDATRIIFHTLPLWMRLGPHHARCFVQYILHHFSSLWRPPDSTLPVTVCYISSVLYEEDDKRVPTPLLTSSVVLKYMVLFLLMTIWGTCWQRQLRSAARFAHTNDVYYSHCIYPLQVVFVWNKNKSVWSHSVNGWRNPAQHCG